MFKVSASKNLCIINFRITICIHSSKIVQCSKKSLHQKIYASLTSEQLHVDCKKSTVTKHFLVNPFLDCISVCGVHTVELKWLEPLWSHENTFQTGVVRAKEC